MKTSTKLILGGIVVASIVAGVYFWNKEPKSATNESSNGKSPKKKSIKPKVLLNTSIKNLTSVKNLNI